MLYLLTILIIDVSSKSPTIIAALHRIDPFAATSVAVHAERQPAKRATLHASTREAPAKLRHLQCSALVPRGMVGSGKTINTICFRWQNVYIDHGSQNSECIMALGKASTIKHLPSSSITHTSSRVYWSFRTFYRAPTACREHPPWRLYR
jgi:hypothetical protein